MIYHAGKGSLAPDVVVVFCCPTSVDHDVLAQLRNRGLTTYTTMIVKVEVPHPVDREVIESWREPLIKELNNLEPRLILAVGEEAIQGLLNNYQPIEEVKGKSYQVTYLPAPVYVASPYEVTSTEFDSLRQYMVK